MLEIGLMGEVTIVRDGETLQLPQSRKTLALLAYLVMTGRMQQRDRLCSLLWEVPNDPRGALRWSLSKLRSLVNEPDKKRILGDRNRAGFERLGAAVDALALREAVRDDLAGMTLDRLEALAAASMEPFLEALELPDCQEFQAWRRAEQDELILLHMRLLHILIRKLATDRARTKPFQRMLETVTRNFPEIEAEAEWLASGPLTVLDVNEADAAIALPEKPSIAVMTFENMSDAADHDYFAEGMTEDIVTALSRFKLLFVISRNSTAAYRKRTVDVRRVGRELGVHYVLEGSVRKSGKRLRVTVQLIDAIRGYQVWAESYDREAEDIFAVQDDITQHIAVTIEPEVMAAEMKRAHLAKSRDPNAREYFFRGMWHYARYSEHDIAEALQIAERGLAAHPENAELHTLVALTCHLNFMYGWHGPRTEMLARAVEAARKAVEQDGQNARVFRCLGVIDLHSKHHDLAIADFRRALEINPNDADGYALLGNALGYTGDYDGALENIRKAVRLSPRDPFVTSWYVYMAHAATIAGHDAMALEWAIRIRQEKPSFPVGFRIAAVAHAHLGHVEEARREIAGLLSVSPGTTLDIVRMTVPIKDEAAMERYLGALRLAGVL